MEVLTKSSKETKSLGEKIAVDVIVNSKKSIANSKEASVSALSGELGSGKTTFVQGLAEGLGVTKRVISPTFILMRKYKLRFTNYELPFTYFYHIDLYRLEENVESEVKNLGIEEIWSSPENIVAIEWAEKIERMIPKSATWIKFENLGGNRRKINVND